jgi:ABC-2 type transport system ATP-binding protein
MTDAIVIDSLSVVRGNKIVLDNLSLSIPSGQIVGLLGPSGCGKTTLMRAIVGVQVTAGGSVVVLDEPAGSAGLRSLAGYMTQAPSVYRDLTVRENLNYFASILGVTHERVEDVIALVDLAEETDKRAGELSGGQLSRVSLAVTLLAEPDLLVLDEPTVGLDPVLRKSLWELFASLAADGKTLLVSSHVMDEAEHCDTLILMREGRVLSNSSVPELLSVTGASNVEQAFLALVNGDEAA